jgi:two-component system chemotaxis response regulator CheY
MSHTTNYYFTVNKKKPMKTLLVSNSPDTLATAKASLERYGHEVFVAEDGVNAWIQLQDAKVPFQVVISDWLLPKLDGLSLCKKIRSTTSVAETYFILVTNRSGSDSLKEGTNAGADDFIFAKPFHADVLGLRLRNAERILNLEKTVEAKSGIIDSLNLKLEQQSTKDKLTGLYNRRSFHRHLEDRLRLSRRMEQPISLLMLDIDRLKEYKEEFGESAADGIIKLITSSLNEHCRTSDFVARFGGEKFGIILPNTGAEGAIKCAEGLCKAAKMLFWESTQVSISIGATTLDDKNYTSESVCDLHTRILSEADQALYQSQSAGQKQVTHFSAMNNKFQMVG